MKRDETRDWVHKNEVRLLHNISEILNDKIHDWKNSMQVHTISFN